MLNILIVEDEAAVRMLTRAKLRNEYNILEAANGAQALELLDHEHIDLIIADIMMPQMDGYELVQALRGNGNMTPIIMLTAMNTYAHKKKGFATGIDDYMTKPIDYEELKWRISALLRRAKIANEKQINVGNLMFKADSLSAEIDGKTVELTEKESSLLYKLLSYPGIVFTKQQLMDEIWDMESDTDERTVDVHINRLRERLKGNADIELATVRGLGYKAVKKQ